MTVKFQKLPVGALFEFRGRRYRKVALSMAHDEDRCGNIFQDQTDVVPWQPSEPARRADRKV